MPKFAAQIDTMGIPVKGLSPEQATAFPTPVWEGRMIHRTDLKTFHIYLNGAWRQCDSQGFAAAAHLHAIADVTGLQAALDAKAAIAHAHAMGDITGLTAALAAKLDQTQVDARISSILDIANAPTTLDTLNELAAALGDDPNFAATITTALGTKAAANHTHALTGSEITGTLSVAKGGTGATTVAGVRAVLGYATGSAGNSPALTPGAWVTYNHGSGVANSTPTFIEVATGENIELDWKWTSNSGIAIRSDVALAAGAIKIRLISHNDS